MFNCDLNVMKIHETASSAPLLRDTSAFVFGGYDANCATRTATSPSSSWKEKNSATEGNEAATGSCSSLRRRLGDRL